MQRADSQELTMKKLTLTAWARILYRKGMIDAARLNRMIALIDNLKETKSRDSAADSASASIVKENCLPLAICGGVWYNGINQSC